MSNTIHLPIQAKWFDMILTGEKKEEYRSVTKYWAKRITNSRLTSINSKRSFENMYQPGKPISIKSGKTTVTFTNGYSKNSRRIEVELLGIEIKKPNPKWCPPNTSGFWFALKLGKIVHRFNL